MTVFQIGAAGGVGRRLSTLLTHRDDDVSGMHRSPSQAGVIAETGATPVPGDLITDSVEDLAGKFSGHDAVVFSAGAHGTGMEQTSFIDGQGLEKAAEAAQRAGIARFILVSTFPESERGNGLGEGFEHYMRVKKTADASLDAALHNQALCRAIVELTDSDTPVAAAAIKVAASTGRPWGKRPTGYLGCLDSTASDPSGRRC